MNVVKYVKVYMNLMDPKAYILNLTNGADQNNRGGFNKSFYRFIAFILMLVPLNLFSQNIVSRKKYTYQIREEIGDLNNDGKMDKITVNMDTTDDSQPLRLQIFLSKNQGKLTLALTSDQAIEPQYPVENQRKYNGFQVPDFIIEKGILKMWQEIKGGNITYHFKYNRGNFELIYVEKLTSDIAKSYFDENTIFTETKFDLIRGIRTETDEHFGSGKVLSIRKKTVLIRPLPRLQDFKFSDKNRY